jgi:cysteine-rich repeat protein
VRAGRWTPTLGTLAALGTAVVLLSGLVSCSVEPVTFMPPGETPPGDAPKCGDHNVDPGEDCDDGAGNGTAGSLCNAMCHVVSCGDGHIDPSEACDEGASNRNGGTCEANCTLPVCGNGIKDMGEACDDHNTASGDGCSSTCITERPATAFDVIYVDDTSFLSNSSTGMPGWVGIINTGRQPLDLSTFTASQATNDPAAADFQYSLPTTRGMLAPGHAAVAFGTPPLQVMQASGLLPEPVDVSMGDSLQFGGRGAAPFTYAATLSITIAGHNVSVPMSFHSVPNFPTPFWMLNHVTRISAP